ncbi:MAG: hypothetical protein IJ789_03350 [Bacteroidales bacterium]|nr:hypothetical protein [Bacteroidales bacterium]
MELTKHTYCIGTQRCEAYAAAEPQALLVQMTSSHQSEELQSEAAAITAAGVPFVLLAVCVDDWEYDLMPWPEPAVSRRPEVGLGAEKTLQFVVGELLPTLPWRHLPVVLGGYSLGGLFALWTSRQTGVFQAIAAASPSLWAGDWPTYAERYPSNARLTYLSLGDREERSRNHTMARVGDRLRAEHNRLVNQLGADHTILVWEQGGHFADPAGRMARAFAWCLSRL